MIFYFFSRCLEKIQDGYHLQGPQTWTTQLEDLSWNRELGHVQLSHTCIQVSSVSSPIGSIEKVSFSSQLFALQKLWVNLCITYIFVANITRRVDDVYRSWAAADELSTFGEDTAGIAKKARLAISSAMKLESLCSPIYIVLDRDFSNTALAEGLPPSITSWHATW